jgi:hypothetical protein
MMNFCILLDELTSFDAAFRGTLRGGHFRPPLICRHRLRYLSILVFQTLALSLPFRSKGNRGFFTESLLFSGILFLLEGTEGDRERERVTGLLLRLRLIERGGGDEVIDLQCRCREERPDWPKRDE